MPTTQEWIDELKSISVLELSERIKALEETFGVSATAVAAAAPAGGAAAAGGGGGAAGGPTAFHGGLDGGGGKSPGRGRACSAGRGGDQRSAGVGASPRVGHELAPLDADPRAGTDRPTKLPSAGHFRAAVSNLARQADVI